MFRVLFCCLFVTLISYGNSDTTTTEVNTVTTDVPTTTNTPIDNTETKELPKDEPVKLELTKTRQIIFTTNNGYISGIVNCDIPYNPITNTGGYLTIKSGTNELNEKDDGRLFYNVKNTTFYFYSDKVFLDFFNDGTVPLDTFKCVVTLKTEENEIVNVTEPPTFVNPPHLNDTQYFLGSIGGKELINYVEETILDLKKSILNMAFKYLDDNINPCTPINLTNASIKISFLQECPIEWPNFEKCVQVYFSVPVKIKNTEQCFVSKSGGYQLDKPHLKEMWEKYGDEELKTIGLEVFNKPNYNRNTMFWLLVTLLSCAIFLVFVGGLKCFNMKPTMKVSSIPLKRQFSSRESKLNNEMDPHYYQDLPDLFEGQVSYNSLDNSSKTTFIEGEVNKGFERDFFEL